MCEIAFTISKPRRHCERSEAIQHRCRDCFALQEDAGLAMTPTDSREFVMQRNRIFSYFIALCALFIATCAYGAGRMPFHQEYIFIHQAKSATLKYDAEHKLYRLTLKEFSPWVFYMSNDSRHESGLMTMNNFMRVITQPSPFHRKTIYGEITGVVAKNNETKTDIRQYTLIMDPPEYHPETNTINFDVRVMLVGQEYPAKPLPAYINLEPVVLIISRKMTELDMRNGS